MWRDGSQRPSVGSARRPERRQRAQLGIDDLNGSHDNKTQPRCGRFPALGVQNGVNPSTLTVIPCPFASLMKVVPSLVGVIVQPSALYVVP